MFWGYRRHKSIYESELEAMRSLKLEGLGLDLGVGTGVFAGRLGVSIGVDPSARMLSFAKRRGVQVVRALGEHLPFRQGCFGYVILINTLCFLDEPGPVLEECARVMGEGGSLVVCDIVQDSAWGRLYEERGRAGHKLYSQARFYTLAELKRLLGDHGFRVVDLKATLKSRPEDPERVEVPSDDPDGRGFVCLVAHRGGC